ncbi:protein FAR1-RELATED SEQUENCE 1-like [Olea europaea var. sylvestris]|uniref:protein FAR1-RELATED SEQUENCE 1-like n=1 Tax=Olea europaea var. sylvestris TaxID=158386 RepID=UPI000C1D1BE4|nr:protein FAR1-RELATED SEQUENCE 1-like [Olea europaea var. sylvestris]
MWRTVFRKCTKSFDYEKQIVNDVGDGTLSESDNDNVMDNSNILDDDIAGVDGPIVPEVGMKFKDKNEMFDFYKRYAYATGCKARLTASSDMCGIWRIYTVHLEHNHKTSPTKSRLYRCNRELSAHVKRQLEVNDMADIPLHKSYNSTIVEAGRHKNMTCLEKDCRNDVEQVRHLRLGEEDAATIQSYFSNMQAKCPRFYFSMDLDEESRPKNVFGRIIGCMHGQAPHGIITDQDRAIQNAIEIVFPNTKHRWCLWHVMKKLPEKFGYHADKGFIFSAIYALVYDSQTIEDFEEC